MVSPAPAVAVPGPAYLFDGKGKAVEASQADVVARLNDPTMQLIDIRDVRELTHGGTVPNAFHAPRGMLEFWVDPASPYYKPVFGDESKEYILFCGAGWRSALATKALQDMGMTNIAHIDGGFTEWVKQGAPTVTRP